MKAKYIDFTEGPCKPGSSFVGVYDIIPDPDVNIYEKSKKIKPNPLGVCPAGRYNWFGLVEDNE